jgi:NAD+ kinase
LSAGGPIINPELSALSITPLSPQSLTTRPIIVSGNTKLSFKISSRDDDVHMDIDGKMNCKIEEKDIIEATLSTKTLTLIKPENRDYFKILREKLKWGDLY